MSRSGEGGRERQRCRDRETLRRKEGERDRKRQRDRGRQREIQSVHWSWAAGQAVGVWAAQRLGGGAVSVRGKQGAAKGKGQQQSGGPFRASSWSWLCAQRWHLPFLNSTILMDDQ